MCTIEQKCIYCNSEDLSISDIIPFALTGAKLTNKFVCKEHNSYTNRSFESTAIRKWDYFRNQLGLKTRDGDCIKFKGNVVIDDIVIKNATLTDKKTFYSDQILSTSYNGSKLLLGYIDKLNQIPKIKPVPIDMKNAQIEYNFSLLDLLISEEMKRTVAKIAYEWHCDKNSISGYDERYNEIVSYIIHGVENSDIIQNVIDAYTFTIANQLCEFGTNSLFEYINESGCCFVIFNFWNVVIYKVKIHDYASPNTLESQILRLSRYNLDGTKDETYFGVLGKIDVVAEKPEDALKRLKSLYLNNLTSLLTNIVLTIYTVKQMINEMADDLVLFKSGEINIADFLYYEEWKRIFTIKLALKFVEKEHVYNFRECFNKNLMEMLNTGEFLRLNEDDKIQLTKTIVQMHDSDTLIRLLENGISIFNNIYKHETESKFL